MLLGDMPFLACNLFPPDTIYLSKWIINHHNLACQFNKIIMHLLAIWYWDKPVWSLLLSPPLCSLFIDRWLQYDDWRYVCSRAFVCVLDMLYHPSKPQIIFYCYNLKLVLYIEWPVDAPTHPVVKHPWNTPTYLQVPMLIRLTATTGL